jgi:hypothetical protein
LWGLRIAGRGVGTSCGIALGLRLVAPGADVGGRGRYLRAVVRAIGWSLLVSGVSLSGGRE